MKSPVPPHARLVPETLRDGLTIKRDPETGGCWIDAGAYWDWVRNQPDFPRTLPDNARDPLPVDDSAAPLLSPKSGRLMRKFEVGFGQTFRIDFDAASGGFWLDPGELDALRACGLNDALHLICSEHYQQRLCEEGAEESHHERIARLLGDDEKRRLDDLIRWLATTDRPDVAMAYIVDAFGRIAEDPPGR